MKTEDEHPTSRERCGQKRVHPSLPPAWRSGTHRTKERQGGDDGTDGSDHRRDGPHVRHPQDDINKADTQPTTIIG